MLRILRTSTLPCVAARTVYGAAGQQRVRSVPRSIRTNIAISERGITSATLNNSQRKVGPGGMFAGKALVGLLIGGAATALYYNHTEGSVVSAAAHKPGALIIASSPNRDTATVTFQLPDKEYSRVFLSLNHCRTNGQDCVNFFVNGQPLRLGCTESPVYDYTEQVFRIPRQMCEPGAENTVTIRLSQPHTGQYWLLDASLDAYEQGPVLVLHNGAQTGKLIM